QVLAVGWDPVLPSQYGLNLLGQYRRQKTFGAEGQVQPYLNGQLLGHIEPYAGFRIEGGYSTQTSRELRREFVYLPVPLGQGTHTWQDANNDGQQTLDEFVEAIYFNEKQYARFFVPTTDYIPAQGQQGNVMIALAAPNSWREGGWGQRLVSKVSFHGRWEFRNKSDLMTLAVPLSKTVQQRYTLYVNRGGVLWGLEGGYVSHQSLQQLSQGPESFDNSHYYAEGRWNLSAKNALVLRYENGLRTRSADFWEGQSWELAHHILKPEWRWVISQHWRLVGNYRWQKSQESKVPSHYADLHELQAQIQWQPGAVAQSLCGQVSYVALNYSGNDARSPIAYRMLEGLQPGNNWRVNVDWTHSLPSGLQLTLFYDGRKVSEVGWVHAGNAQIAWVF
ncbi:MAG: hypothetical protein AAFQ98_09335, partial [Bacteroidota bacterium]